MRKVLRGMLWAVAVAGVLLLAVALLMTNPVKTRPFASGVSVDPSRLRSDVEALTGLPGYRCFERADDLDRAAEWVRSALEASGLPVEEMPFAVGDRSFRNFIARYGPEGAPVLVVGAHYDVCGEQPGADDNASAVAGVLELARLLERHRPDVAYRLELALWPLEEPPNFRTPAMGSAVHARWLADGEVRIGGMICLEMLGYFSDRPGSQSFPVPGMGLLYPSRGNFIAVVGNGSSWRFTREVKARMDGATELPVRSINAPALVPGVDFSDHSNFWKQGWKAVMITDTAFYRNPNYHQLTDTPDTLDYGRMAQVVTGVYAAITTL
ncbi:MAG: M28 family peptidase [Thermoanaerobaculales bacterium]|nr:M28 family peptidase [Thermoanaerobaculales bacterium]